MIYEYLTPEDAAARFDAPVEYYKDRNITSEMTKADLTAEVMAGRVSIVSVDVGLGLYTVVYTRFYYTDAGRLKLDTDTGAFVMDENSPIRVKVTII